MRYRHAMGRIFLPSLGALLTLGSVALANPPENRVVIDRSGWRTAGWITLGVGGVGGVALALGGLAAIPGGCSEVVGGRCHGGDWGWSVAGAIIAGVTIPIGIILVLQHDVWVTTQGTGLRFGATF